MRAPRVSFLRSRFRHLSFCAALLACAVANAQVFVQQGGKLAGNDTDGSASQGWSVALSSNGNTAVIGAPQDGEGAIRIFTRDTQGNWNQQGSRLVGSGAGPDQGWSVAISSDGNTVLVGGPYDQYDTYGGAAWVFTRDQNGNWSQQGSPLTAGNVYTTNPQGVEEGYSVALSGDGNTALIGGIWDINSGGAGAAWVFTRDGSGNWTQQAKLVGTGAVGYAAQGWSVALSGDGNTALIGGPVDNNATGAAWVFTRDNTGTWTQQGSKLVGAGAVAPSDEGSSVSLSTDGNTALVGGYGDNSRIGAAWVFVRDSNGNWTQQGSKLVGSDDVNEPLIGVQQGYAVALSGDGNTALVGGPNDNDFVGAVWVFKRDSGNWTQQGSKLVGTGAVGAAQQGYSVALSGDASTAIEGGPYDSPFSNGTSVGAAWVFLGNGSGPPPSQCPPSSSTSFCLIPGSLSQISIPADGNVWGLNSAQQIFAYNSSTQSWTNIPGSLTQIAVGSSNAVWGLNENEQIYDWDPVHSQWINIPGSLAQIAVGADGDVWGLNYQSSVYHYDAQTAFWMQVPGQLAHIAVGSAGAVYGMNSSGGAFWYNPGTGYFQYLGGPAFSQIAVGADGSLIGISDGVVYTYSRGAFQSLPEDFAAAQVALGTGASVYALDASGNVYYANGLTQSWNQIPGTLSSIGASGNGAVWGLNSAQEVFTLQNAPMRGYQTLTSVSGSLNQISVGADGNVWGVSANTVEYFNSTTQNFQPVSGAPSLAQVSVGAGGKIWGLDAAGNIYEWDAASATFNNVPGQLNFIQVAANGSVWGINAAGQTYTYSNNTWTNVPGTLQTLSVGADGTVWGINAQQQIYRFDGQSWANVPGSLAQISVGNANNIWGINAQGEVYYYDNARGWVIIPGAYLTNISVAFDGTVWGVNATGGLYQWNAGTQTFNSVGSGVTNVFVGNAAAVWALNTGSGAVFSWF